jgi:hypothetical protein
MKTEINRPTEEKAIPARLSRSSWRPTKRGWVAIGLGLLLVAGAVTFLLRPDDPPPLPQDLRGTPSWATEHYGNANAPRFRDRNIIEIDFLGEPMYVHEKAARHFLRLAQIFEARAPEYAATIAAGASDDWSYQNRSVRGEKAKSNHAFGLALDVNALTNVLGTAGDMPTEVVEQWEVEGGVWGGVWARPDPMHFETHLTPEEISHRYQPDGTPQAWYLEELVGG